MKLSSDVLNKLKKTQTHPLDSGNWYCLGATIRKLGNSIEIPSCTMSIDSARAMALVLLHLADEIEEEL